MFQQSVLQLSLFSFKGSQASEQISPKSLSCNVGMVELQMSLIFRNELHFVKTELLLLINF